MARSWIANLLWLDGTAGFVAGLAVIVAHRPLAALYAMPTGLLMLVGVINMAYGTSALLLARRRIRPLALIGALAVANVAWCMVCVVLVLRYASTASVFGLAHLLVEGAVVATLAALEWRHRQALRVA